MYDKMRYWITPDGGLVDVPEGRAHHHVSRRLIGLNAEDALKQGWIRVVRDNRFSAYWYFEIQNADDDTLALIEDFIMSPENPQTGGDIAASVSIVEPSEMSFPIEWKDLEGSSFKEAAESSFQRELRRPEGRKWYELRGTPRRRGRR